MLVGRGRPKLSSRQKWIAVPISSDSVNTVSRPHARAEVSEHGPQLSIVRDAEVSRIAKHGHPFKIP